MMWLVQVALRRPLSVAVLALLMLVLGTLSFAYMNIDIFPAINLPVVMMVWNYPGLSPFDMERRMVTISERALSTTVNAIEHLESESIQGIGIVKLAMAGRIVRVQREEIGEETPNAEDRQPFRLRPVVQDIRGIQEDRVADQEILQRPKVHGQVHLLLQIADRP